MILRNVEVNGRPGLDVELEGGRILRIGPNLPAARRGEELDGEGGALIPGLVDHHIHILALAARAASVDLAGADSARELRRRIEAAAAARPPGDWIRAIGYHETMAGKLGRDELDALAPRHPLRIQHQTGSLWMLNSLALAALGDGELPACVERDPAGELTGRIWRGDAWLRTRIGAQPPPLAPIGRQLAAFGITALTDASVTTEATAALRLAEAARAGELPQRLTLMSGGALDAPADGAFRVGPVKVLLDEHDLPALDDFAASIARARRWGRAVAVHCVTATELALTLAAFEVAGACSGDRIEHGGIIPEDAIEQIGRLGLTVVTQPAFIRERGERYAAGVPEEEHADLYRCASLKAAGAPLAGSSDAPYGSADPWLGIAAAIDRKTCAGRLLGAEERLEPVAALELYLTPQDAPGRAVRRVEPGAAADLCLLKAPLREVLASPSSQAVRATFIHGRLVHG